MVKSIKVLSPEEELSHGQVSVTVVKWQFLTKGRGSVEAQEKRYNTRKRTSPARKYHGNGARYMRASGVLKPKCFSHITDCLHVMELKYRRETPKDQPLNGADRHSAEDNA